MNKVILIGRLTRDPDVRWSQGQDQTGYARFTLAVDRKLSKAARENENQQTADFISCVVFGTKSVEWYEKYAHQGLKVVVEGRIQTGSYTNREGQKVYTTDVVIENTEFAESKRTSGEAYEPKPDKDGFMNASDDPYGTPFS